MKKNTLRFLSFFLVLVLLVGIVACNNEAKPATTDDSGPKSAATTFFMPNGWAQKVTTPVWTSKDNGTVDTSKINLVLEGDMNTNVTNVTPELKAALAAAVANPNYFKDVKNVIIIISDGMGITHVQASEHWSGELIMTKLPNVGASKTLTREGIYTDSAAGGTAISSGYKTTKLFVNVDAEGNNLKSVSELARDKGKLVGVVTNAELADATPACFTVHNKHRSQGWTKMCQQQVVFGADLFMGNGYSDYSSYFNSSNDMYPFVEENNMKLFKNASDVVSHFSDSTKMWAIFPEADASYVDKTGSRFARFDGNNSKYPNLQQMTSYALAWLDAHDTDDEGFIVMIENTYTDHFGHGKLPQDGSSNTYGIVKEVQSTDEAVAIALKYVLEHPDTALIVTADHETGETSLRSGWKDDFSRVKADSGDHSTQNVPVFAIGKGTEKLNTLTRSEEERSKGAKWDEAQAYENAFIGQVIGELLGDSSFGGDVKTDTDGKTSAKFDVKVTESASSVTFTLDLNGVPVRAKNFVQFKIKPAQSSDSIKVELNDGTNNVTLFDTTVFSTTNNNTIERDENKNVTTSLMKAYKQSFVEGSGFDDGWYQFSVPATVDSKKIIITLNGSFPANTVIGMDDLTIQYGSTIGELLFSSNNATATGECLVKLN